MAAILKMSKYKTQLQFDISNEKIIPNYRRKNIFIVMTSSMTSQSDLKVVSLYSFMNDNYRTTKDIIFKLSTHMYHWIVNMRLQAILECFVDDVIRSQNKSKLWTTIALSKFKLEKRSTAQNVANWTGYQKFKFQFHIQISKFWQVRNLRLSFHLIGVIALVLQDIYHNIIVFSNISWIWA